MGSQRWAHLPSVIGRQRSIKVAKRRSWGHIPGAEVQKQPGEARRHGNWKTVCAQQCIHFLLFTCGSGDEGKLTRRALKVDSALLRMPCRSELMHKCRKLFNETIQAVRILLI
jgi:hypothetical protein